MKVIQSRPFISFKKSMRVLVGTRPNHEQMLFLFGREALIHLINQNSSGSSDIIALPGFICKSITDSLDFSNIKYVYYDITSELQVNINSLARCLKEEKVSAVLIVHYFGFLHENKEARALINEKESVIIIDDFCHSFGSYCINQIHFKHSFSSVRKYFPVKVSGVIFDNSIEKQFQHVKVSDCFYVISRLCEFVVSKVFRINIYNVAIDRIKNRLREVLSKKKLNSGVQQKKPKAVESSLTRAFIDDLDLIEETALQARKNFNIYRKHIKSRSVKAFFAECTKQDVPQWFVIDSKYSTEIVRYLRSSGIGAIQWPGSELPIETLKNINCCPVSNQISQRLALLPVHYTLKEKDILYIIKKLNHCINLIELNYNERN